MRHLISQIPMMRFWVSACMVFAGVAWAGSDPALESKIQSDLEGMLSRMIPRERFAVQVNSTVDTVQERRLIEGETVVQNPGSPQVVVPPLPGFNREVPPAPATPGQSRQVFRMVDKQVLSAVQIQVTIDESLDKQVIERTKTLVGQYASASYGAKAKVAVTPIQMLSQSPPVVDRMSDVMGKWLPWALAALALVFAYFLYRRSKREEPRVVYPSVQRDHGEEEAVVSPVQSKHPGLGPPPWKGDGRGQSSAFPHHRPLALPSTKGNFPALPATETFVDRRAELLQKFLQNSDTFRLYYMRLPEAAQGELYAGLRGPAFDSLLENLGLEIPEGADTSMPPSEEQMVFYFKNFDEFIQAHSWQNAQFFGFLKGLKVDELVTLAKGENAIVVALMIRFLPPQISGAVLSALPPEQRLEALTQLGRVNQIGTEELTSIERSVRARVDQLPRFLMGSNQMDDAQYWSRVLALAPDQEAILMDIERTNPGLYPMLAKFRFKLEDVPSLPPPLIAKVLDQVDNEELALALAGLQRDVSEVLLGEINVNRRSLLRSQISMLQGVDVQQLSTARQALTLKFREVIA